MRPCLALRVHSGCGNSCRHLGGPRREARHWYGGAERHHFAKGLLNSSLVKVRLQVSPMSRRILSAMSRLVGESKLTWLAPLTGRNFTLGFVEALAIRF